MAQDGVMPEIKVVQDTYKVGQKICLWQEDVDPNTGTVTILKEVIVTITETKTGVPSEHSGQPSSRQSLKGVGDDGKTYRKHWVEWPEAQLRDFTDQWSMRDDGEGQGPQRFWFPREAVYAHNSLIIHNRKHGESHGVFHRVDQKGGPILPKGDVCLCEKHDEYFYPGTRCFQCLIDDHKAVKA